MTIARHRALYGRARSLLPPTRVDLRPSEALALRRVLTDAKLRALDTCEAIIANELTAAGVAFAAQHPDAPRATA